jgi:hypothetical protein
MSLHRILASRFDRTVPTRFSPRKRDRLRALMARIRRWKHWPWHDISDASFEDTIW